MKVTGREALDRFLDMQIGGATIIEHRPNNENIVGRVEYAGVNGGGASFGIGWAHSDGGNRTTLFYSHLWEMEIVEKVILIKRTKEGNPDQVDMPWEGCILYTIFLGDRR